MNFKEMCRTCLRTGEMMSSIFDVEIEPAKHTAAELLAMFTFVEVDKEDDFPHNICGNCLKEIQQAYLFDLKCKKSEIILHQLREIRVKLKKLKEIPKQNDIVSEVAGELESIPKEDVMNLCDRNIGVSESSAIERIKPLVSQVTLKKKPDHTSRIIKNNPGQNELELNQNSPNFEIFGECDAEYQVLLKTEPDQNNLIIKDKESEDELQFSVTDFPVTFKSEPELDLGIDCYDEQLECSACLKQFQSLDIFRGHIVSDHLEENICKLCNEEFECSQIEHSGKHLPFSHLVAIEPDNPSDSSEESIRQTEKVPMTVIHKDEFFDKPYFQCKICSKVFNYRCRLVNHLRTHTGEKPVDCELCPEKPGNSSSSARTNHTDKLINDDKPVPDFQCSVCFKIFGHKWILRRHMHEHTGEKPFQCKLCPDKFQRCDALKSHEQTEHTDQKPFDCKFCPAKFRNSKTLLYHRQTKHTDKLIIKDKPLPDLKCSVCNKVFGKICLLRYHMRSHNGENPFHCEFCPEKFRSSTALRYHRRTKHTDELISKDKPLPDFQCSVCDKVFCRKSLLKIHMRVHTGEKQFQCKLCPEKFRISSDLLCHRRSKHTDELITDNKLIPDFQCSVCFKIFGLKWLLRRHMYVHTGEKPFKCKLCPKKFQRSDALKSHEQSEHTNQKPFVCKFCPAKFRNSRTLLYHRQTKHTDKLISKDKPLSDFQCSVCDKVFCRKSLLKIHMRVHTGEKQFQCKLCPEKFRISSDLLCHRRSKHTDELITDNKLIPDFQCSVCFKIFGLKWLLRRHMYVHTGEKPFKCKLCPKKFQRSDALKSHEQSEHTNQKPFVCKFCPAKFRNSRTLLYHRQTKHTDKLISKDKPLSDFQCSVCDKVFCRKSLLKIHMRVHTGEKQFQCKLCPEKFRISSDLLCHRRSKHTDELITDNKLIPDFQCSVCLKIFGHKWLLRRHMYVHTGEKPFKCKLCPKKFQRSDALKSHEQTEHTDQKPFDCKFCNKVFGKKCLLRYHMRSHTGENPFHCEFCPEKLRSSTALRYHRRTKHTDELISADKAVSDFQCSICYKVFGVKTRLKNHMRVHSGEKPIDCELCPEKFVHNRALLCHRRTKHTKEFISEDKPEAGL